jgi:hypothetical protein
MSAAGRAARLLLLGAGIALIAGCAHRASPPPLYLWESFPKLQYDTLAKPGVTPLDQVAAMEAQAERARADGARLPPGFRAHLGMLKLSAGDVARARQLWLDEESAFPESSPYMDQLLKRLDGPVAMNKDKPA